MMNALHQFILICLSTLGLLLQTVQVIALWTRNKWIVIASVVGILTVGFYVYTEWNRKGVYFFFGGVMVLTLIGSGLYKISGFGLDKIETAKAKVKAKLSR